MTFYYVYKLIAEIVHRYDIAIIDYFSVLIILFLLLIALKLNKWRLHKIGLLGIILILLPICFLYSFKNAPTQAAFKSCVVFISGIFLCLAFSLLMTERKLVSFMNITWIVMFILFWINLIAVVAGLGGVKWGGSLTLKGLYYYKTDYATFILQFLILTQYKLLHSSKEKRWLYYTLIFFASALTVLSGSRIFIIVLGFYYVTLFCSISRRRIRDLLNIRTIVFMLVAVIVSLHILNLVAQIFPDRNMLTFDFEDIFSDRNTQGRRQIWLGIGDYILNQTTFMQKMFGVDLVSSASANPMGLRAHSMYIYIWYSFGVIGIIVFAVFFLCVLRLALNTKNRDISYLLFLVWEQTMVSGVTQEIIFNTQQTWFLFMVLGIALAEQYNGHFYFAKKETILNKVRNKGTQNCLEKTVL